MSDAVLLILQMRPSRSTMSYTGWIVRPAEYQSYSSLGQDFVTASVKLRNLLPTECQASEWQDVWSGEETTVALHKFFLTVTNPSGPVTMLSAYVYAQSCIQDCIRRQLENELSTLPEAVLTKLLSEFETSPVLFNPEVLPAPSIPVFLQYSVISIPE